MEEKKSVFFNVFTIRGLNQNSNLSGIFLLSQTQCEKVMVNKIDFEILMDLHFCSTPEYENVLHMRWKCHVERITRIILMGLNTFILPEYEKVSKNKVVIFFKLSCLNLSSLWR